MAHPGAEIAEVLHLPGRLADLLLVHERLYELLGRGVRILGMLQRELHRAPQRLIHREDRAGLVGVLPPIRKDHLEAEVGVVETVAHEITGARIVAEDDPLDMPAVALLAE